MMGKIGYATVLALSYMSLAAYLVMVEFAL